jgi:cytochrome c2
VKWGTTLFAAMLAPALFGAGDHSMASADRGAKLFESLACIQCHSAGGKGGTAAPDLARSGSGNFTPVSFAAAMWNHAPAMWSAIGARKLELAEVNEQAARDLFAFLYATRFPQTPGDAARGKRVFAAARCATCHGLTEPLQPMIKPVNRWDALDNTIVMAEEMWNHCAYMLEQSGINKTEWPQLSAQDLRDILIYVRKLPEPPSRPRVTMLGTDRDGAAVFNARGCPVCHKPGSSLGGRVRGETPAAIAAEMWNHAPWMAAEGAKPVELAPGEMQDLLDYLWARQFFQGTGDDKGDPAAGRRVFEGKRCATCHRGGAPQIEGASFTASGMVSALWQHGPRMWQQMRSKGVAWPRFEGTQMQDLLAFLSSGGQDKN